jgi:hypothetical protein
VAGTAIRLEEWWAVPVLALQPIGTDYVYVSWLRHALTYGSRNEAFPKHESGQQVNGAFIAVARQAAARIPALRPDVTGSEPPPPQEPPAPDDPILDSLCQADLLWCVLAVLDGGKWHGQEYYPSFAALYERRIQPVLRVLATSSVIRHELFDDTPLDEVVAATNEVLESASREGRFGFERMRLQDVV